MSASLIRCGLNPVPSGSKPNRTGNGTGPGPGGMEPKSEPELVRYPGLWNRTRTGT